MKSELIRGGIMKKAVLVVMVFMIMASFSACGSKKSASDETSGRGNVKQDMAVADSNGAAAPKAEEKSKAVVDEGRKIIQNVTCVIDVKDLKGAYDSVMVKSQEIGGYVANSSIRDANSQITVRVPSAKLEDFIKFIDTLGGQNVETSRNADDVTEQYTDVISRLKNLKAQEEQLLTIMKKADTVEDTLKVQSELFRVRGDIEVLQGKINMWDKLVEFSTVVLRLNKIQEIGGKDVKVSFISLSEIAKGMSNGFKTTLNFAIRFISGIFVLLISLIPIIPFIAFIVWLVVKYRKKIKFKKNVGQ